MLPNIKSYMHIRMYMYEFSIWTFKLVKGVSHLGQLTSWLVASSMRRKSFLVTTNKLQIWSVWIVLVCICLECNLLEIKLPTYLPMFCHRCSSVCLDGQSFSSGILVWGSFNKVFSSGVPVYIASIRMVAQRYPSVHRVNQWHSSAIPVYIGPASVHWLRVLEDLKSRWAVKMLNLSYTLEFHWLWLYDSFYSFMISIPNVTHPSLQYFRPMYAG